MRIVTVKNDKGIYIPPFMSDFTKEESDLIGKLWDISTKQGYIADSLGCTQCLALMYDELPCYFKILFKNVERTEVSYEDYERGFW